VRDGIPAGHQPNPISERDRVVHGQQAEGAGAQCRRTALCPRDPCGPGLIARPGHRFGCRRPRASLRPRSVVHTRPARLRAAVRNAGAGPRSGGYTFRVPGRSSGTTASAGPALQAVKAIVVPSGLPVRPEPVPAPVTRILGYPPSACGSGPGIRSWRRAGVPPHECGLPAGFTLRDNIGGDPWTRLRRRYRPVTVEV
jgi:hypothetical protein